MKKPILSLLLGACLCWSAPPQSKLSGDLANADPQSSVRVIVQWTTAPDEAKDRKVFNR